jgi:hypothetical protein
VLVSPCAAFQPAHLTKILILPTRYRPYKSFSMQILSCSSAFCLLAISGLLLRSQALVSAARSPNYEFSNPDSESEGISNELNIVIALLVLLLSFPVFMVISLMPRSQSVLRCVAGKLRNFFDRISTKQTSSDQRMHLEGKGLSKPYESATSAPQITGVEITRSNHLPQATMQSPGRYSSPVMQHGSYISQHIAGPPAVSSLSAQGSTSHSEALHIFPQPHHMFGSELNRAPTSRTANATHPTQPSYIFEEGSEITSRRTALPHMSHSAAI